jgi:hypothetical protein
LFCSGQVISGLYPGVTTVELDNLAAEIAATMTTYHPDYATLAARYVPTSVPDPCVFWHPGSGSTSQRYGFGSGSGSFIIMQK